MEYNSSGCWNCTWCSRRRNSWWTWWSCIICTFWLVVKNNEIWRNYVIPPYAIFFMIEIDKTKMIRSYIMVIYILLICAVILLNITISILINKKIQNIYYNKKMSREYVLYKFNFLRQYLLGVVVIISLFILGFASAKIMGHIGIHKSRILSVILVWILVTFLVLLHQLILHNTYKKIRDVQSTYWDEVDITIRYLLMIFILASIVIIWKIYYTRKI
ncbi:hypothetical protein EDC21_11111 [Thermohydrogenium kirishiense]|nr:hypothetical protein EDC21_11111 [Thermohydrogenium kirishiense]